MAKRRKTIELQLVIDTANNNLARTDSVATIAFKIGICNMIETILINSGTYEGYFHSDKDDCEFGTMGYFTRKYF